MTGMRPSVAVRKLPGASSLPSQPTNCHERSKICSFSRSSHSGCVYQAAGSVRPGSYANSPGIGRFSQTGLAVAARQRARRFLFLKASIDEAAQWAVIQPNAEALRMALEHCDSRRTLDLVTRHTASGQGVEEC